MDEIEEIRKRRMDELMKGMSYPDKPMEMTDGNFSEIIQKYPLVVVDFWADWCMPCKMIAQVIDGLAEELSGKVVFGKVNVDQNGGTAAQFGIRSIPTLLTFKDGKLVDSMVGAVPREQIEAKIKPHMD